MASTTKNRPSITTDASVSTFLSSVVDSTKVLIDDVLENAKNAEKGTRRRVNDVADKDLRKTLEKQTKTLTDQVEKLGKARKGK
ncbi:hypothetical protein P0W64_21555 [Tsukamurella sp. 8F]|uniref:hypothetical protein n=1 Tax=unclassified Tsukamurella TaxID=2633480 RepID=UPI0023B9CEA8|nr:MULTISPECIES: hypothetical protein [unclassified Tsukamurella]MDF0532364.1 hypothetical protein [Tsukamurella sp. 8J]MDF0589372.1 hypothetical protein [Tsukamurella sp. 8F]